VDVGQLSGIPPAVRVGSTGTLSPVLGWADPPEEFAVAELPDGARAE